MYPKTWLTRNTGALRVAPALLMPRLSGSCLASSLLEPPIFPGYDAVVPMPRGRAYNLILTPSRFPVLSISASVDLLGPALRTR